MESDRDIKATILPHQAVHDVNSPCRQYLLELLQEIKARLPTNVEQLKSLSELAPSVILGPRKPKLNELSFLPLCKDDLISL